TLSRAALPISRVAETASIAAARCRLRPKHKHRSTTHTWHSATVGGHLIHPNSLCGEVETRVGRDGKYTRAGNGTYLMLSCARLSRIAACQRRVRQHKEAP